MDKITAAEETPLVPNVCLACLTLHSSTARPHVNDHGAQRTDTLGADTDAMTIPSLSSALKPRSQISRAKGAPSRSEVLLL